MGEWCGKEGWKWKRRMEMEENDSRRHQQPPEDQGSTNGKKKYVKSQTKKYQSPQLQAGDLLCFEKLSTYTGLIKKY